MSVAIDPLSLDFGRDKEFCVYIYRDPRPGKKRQPIYVGKGQTKFMPQQHWQGTSHPNKLFLATLTEIRAAGLPPIVEFVAFFDNETEALELEAALIRKFKGNDSLCNVIGVRPSMECRITVPMKSELITRIDAWRRKRPDIPTRAEAIRRLVEGKLAKRR